MTAQTAQAIRALIERYDYLTIDEDESVKDGFMVFDERSNNGIWIAREDQVEYLVTVGAERYLATNGQNQRTQPEEVDLHGPARDE
jgi:hypothetical protein